MALNLMITELFFFFKQKTAYEMRISDWSSDVCSSDLRSIRTRHGALVAAQPGERARSYSGRGWSAADRQHARTIARLSGFRAADGCQIWQIGRASWRERVCQYV